MLNFLRRLPKYQPPAITAEAIIARVVLDINTELWQYVRYRAKRNTLDMRAPGALDERRALTELMAQCGDSANTLYHLAQHCGFAEQLDLDPDLVNEIRIVLTPLIFKAA